jgi:hypothetical protein
MVDTDVVEHTFSFYTYKDSWERVKKRLCATDEQLESMMGDELQMYAWSDILDNIKENIFVDIEDDEQ